jgi:serine/threonine protein kinase
VKPGNVVLTSGGAKLLDFGLAKNSPLLVGSAVGAISSMTPSTPTMTIVELSSPAKALTQRAEADARSDIFSLGCMLYEMATGHRAFEPKSQFSVLNGHP